MVYDCVYHPETLQILTKNVLCDTAIEGINREFSMNIPKQYKVIKMSFKGNKVPTIIRSRNGRNDDSKTGVTAVEEKKKKLIEEIKSQYN